MYAWAYVDLKTVDSTWLQYDQNKWFSHKRTHAQTHTQTHTHTHTRTQTNTNTTNCSLALKQINVDNRKLYLFAIASATCGSLLLADWQAIGDDPCITDSVNSSASDSYEYNNRYTVWTNNTYSTQLSHNLSSPHSLFLNEARRCELQSTSKRECFWNPRSRITGKLCADCYRVCRSKQMSLNFVQFCLGLILYVVTIPLSTVCITAILSSLTPLKSQVNIFTIIALWGISHYIIETYSTVI